MTNSTNTLPTCRPSIDINIYDLNITIRVDDSNAKLGAYRAVGVQWSAIELTLGSATSTWISKTATAQEMASAVLALDLSRGAENFHILRTEAKGSGATSGTAARRMQSHEHGLLLSQPDYRYQQYHHSAPQLDRLSGRDNRRRIHARVHGRRRVLSVGSRELADVVPAVHIWNLKLQGNSSWNDALDLSKAGFKAGVEGKMSTR
jgi:hypothetical protein